jgi:RNA polymerase sigma factor (sigma-70 family)
MPSDEADDESDIDLVRSAQSGELRAFDALIYRHGKKLYAMVYNMTSHHEDTNDLLQDIFAKAFQSIEKFRGQSSFYTWVYTIAMNMTLNFLKKKNRRAGLSLNELDHAVLTDPALIDSSIGANPVALSELKYLQKRLNEAMQELSEEHRAVVTMFDIQGIPHSDICEILKVSEGTVRSRLHYAHQYLQGRLQDLRK